MEIPYGEVDAGDRLCERSRLTALQGEHACTLCEFLEYLRRLPDCKSRDRGSQHLIHKSRAMFGAGGWKVRPHLSPTHISVGVFHTDEYRRPVQHSAERGDDRRRQRIAIAKGLDATDCEVRRCHFKNPERGATSPPLVWSSYL